MTFILNQVPGFADQKDSSLAAEKSSLGVSLNRISQNANMGMVRLEVDYQLKADGETVDLPVSKVDGYQYTRDELLYSWAVSRTVDPVSGWITGPGALWWGAWVVNQATGLVSISEFYRNSHSGLDGNSALTHDGVLAVTVYCQRRRTSLTLDARPYEPPFRLDSDFSSDSPQDTLMMLDLNNGAKRAVVGQEVIYMGEYYNGQAVARPVSPADGYRYELGGEAVLLHSYRWTTLGNSPGVQIPDNANRQLQDFACSINATTGVVTTRVDYKDDSNTGINTTSHGRVAVFAICNRKRRERNGNFDEDASVPPVGWSADSSDPNGVSGPTASVPGALYYGTAGSGPEPEDTAFILDNTAAGLSDNVALYPWPSERFRPRVGDHYTITGWIKVLTANGNRLGSLIMVTYDASNTPLQSTAVQSVSGSWTKVSISLTVTDIHTFKLRIGLVNGFAGTIAAYARVQLYKTVSGSPSSEEANDFSEISEDTFMPGETLRASTALQLWRNVQESLRTPEFFGVTNYTHGQTVALPVSPEDGYTYIRSELAYAFDWHDTGPQVDLGGGNMGIRIVMCRCKVDDSGLVGLSVWRFQPGQVAVETHGGSIDVVVIGKRQANLGIPFSTDTDTERPQSDPPDENFGGQVFLVNDV